MHFGSYLNWGMYDEEVPPEFWVHSLEHGGIVVLYNCKSNCANAKQALKDFYSSAPPDSLFQKIKILITPNSKITLPVIALAWGFQLDLPNVNQEALLNFYQNHVNKGPELVP
jgi:hypothetical protein